MKRMQCFTKFICPFRNLVKRTEILALTSGCSKSRSYSSVQEDNKISDLLDYMERLKNYEKLSVPRGAGTDSEDGFDLGRMRRFLEQLGNPHYHFQAVHIAGTKGKGSTAAFLSNILRQGGYSVGCYTSPHLLTVRECISFGKKGGHISADALINLFHQTKEIIDQSIELENGSLTYFEVFTGLAFLAFFQEKVDIAVIEAGLGGARDATNVLRNTELAASVITSIGEEHLAALGGSLESIAVAKSGIIKHGCPVVIGGPFESHVEHIIRDKAHSMNSPVVSACDPGIKSAIKCFSREDGDPYQTSDIRIQGRENLEMFVDLPDVKLRMLGNHQLQNAVTATCTALCLRNQGFKISDKSIRAGLEQTTLPGRNQFLTRMEAETLGVSEASILIDGAHTEASAEGLSDVIRMTCPDGMFAFVVAMATDKDHLAFARKILTGPRPEIVLLTEVSIAGGKSRATPASILKDAWRRTAADLCLDFMDFGVIDEENNLNKLISCTPASRDNKIIILASCQNLSVCDSIKIADQLLKFRDRDKSRLIVVTGSLHIVSSTLAAVSKVDEMIVS
ncbi:dihydrofolate synthetase isoform X2 [Asparagus officinalis]|nr:dihydrofolate synthetase isoform X2 [Asparagus officinalis]